MCSQLLPVFLLLLALGLLPRVAAEDDELKEVVFEGETHLDGAPKYFYQVTLGECRSAPKWNPNRLTPPPLALVDAMKFARAHLKKNITDLGKIEFMEFKLTMMDSEDSNDVNAQWEVDQFWAWIVTFSNTRPRGGSGLNPPIDVIVLMNGFCPSCQLVEN